MRYVGGAVTAVLPAGDTKINYDAFLFFRASRLELLVELHELWRAARGTRSFCGASVLRAFHLNVASEILEILRRQLNNAKRITRRKTGITRQKAASAPQGAARQQGKGAPGGGSREAEKGGSPVVFHFVHFGLDGSMLRAHPSNDDCYRATTCGETRSSGGENHDSAS